MPCSTAESLRVASPRHSVVSMSSQNSSCCGRSSSSEASSKGERANEAMPWEIEFLSDEEQQAAAVVQSLKMSYEHRQRRLLSQRRLGQPEIARVEDFPAFLLRPDHLAEDDVLLLQTFSNSIFFEQLLEAIKSSRRAGSSREDMAWIDAVFRIANPLFQQEYAILGRPNRPECNNGDDGGSTSSTSARLARLDEYVDEDPKAQTMKKAWKPLSLPKRADHEKIARKTSKRSRSMQGGQPDKRKAMPTSVGLVAQTMQQWEKHLETELAAEGETVDSFRQGRTKTNHIEKEQFQRKAQWNEFLHEKTLEDQQRELAMKRAIRRGEVNP